MVKQEDLELFKLILLANDGNIEAKWKIVWRFNELIEKKATINTKYSEECQEYIEKSVFKSIDKFETLRNIKKFKKFS